MSSYNPRYGSAPPKKSGPSVLLILAIVGIIGFVGIALLVGVGVYMFSKAANDSEQLKQVFADDGISSLMVPDNWAPLPKQFENPDASLQQANVFGERYIIVISERVADLAQAPGLRVETIDDYSELVLAQMDSGMTVQRKGTSKFKVNGMDAVRHKIYAQFDGMDIVYWITFVQGKRHFHQVMAWTERSDEQKNEQSLLDISDSFKETR